MTDAFDPITLTREIVGQLVLFLEDFGQTSAANDAGLSTSNLVRNLRALLAETKPAEDKCVACGGTGKAAGYHDVDHYYRAADGAVEALARHGITPKPPLDDAGGGGLQATYDLAWNRFYTQAVDRTNKSAFDEGVGCELGDALRSLAQTPVGTTSLKVAFAAGFSATKEYRENLESENDALREAARNRHQPHRPPRRVRGTGKENMTRLTIYVCRRMMPWDGQWAVYSHEPFMDLPEAMMCQQEWCNKSSRYKADIVVVESIPADVKKHKGPDTKKVVRETMERQA